ncbi:Uncharacterised protein [Burkholderia pseudomallei]|nr:hypothetical protein [Burkholderia pseudomallei]CAJ3485730.1 Uncharacterised protein [Burkholderia pseudomallei]CAJ4617044.1 Uncharacterised protein [Burkholderia pseudomallei]CAJ5599308.1 Uncharacterised protein [Burkholderia pseudomallei]CAJ6080791.1 Uncharacterised protein [Burkholderia pseudomallei]CAJ7961529.1 Uncharacterised protein [Burkholderia pseudomallei]
MLTTEELSRFAALLALRAGPGTRSTLVDEDIDELTERHPVLKRLVPLASGNDNERTYLVLQISLLRAAIAIVGDED